MIMAHSRLVSCEDLHSSDAYLFLPWDRCIAQLRFGSYSSRTSEHWSFRLNIIVQPLHTLNAHQTLK